MVNSAKLPHLCFVSFCLAMFAVFPACQKERQVETTRVEEGDSLVHVAPRALAAGDVRIEAVQSSTLADTVSLSGRIQADPLRVAHAAPRVAGTVERVNVVVGDRVTKGQVVAYLYSPEFSAAQGDYLLAHERLEKSTGSAGQDLSILRSIVESSRHRLGTLGATSSDIQQLHAKHEPLQYMPLHSPIAGVVTEVEAGVGKQVAAGTDVFGVADLREVWGVLDAYERDFGRLRVGQSALVHATAYPLRSFSGRVASLEGSVKEETRTLSVRVRVGNPGLLLKPGMFISARVSTGVSRPTVVIKEAAVQETEGRAVVYVALTDSTFAPRRVEVRPLGSNLVEVVQGLVPGERIATEGAFLVKSQASKAELGEE